MFAERHYIDYRPRTETATRQQTERTIATTGCSRPRPRPRLSHSRPAFPLPHIADWIAPLATLAIRHHNLSAHLRRSPRVWSSRKNQVLGRRQGTNRSCGDGESPDAFTLTFTDVDDAARMRADLPSRRNKTRARAQSPRGRTTSHGLSPPPNRISSADLFHDDYVLCWWMIFAITHWSTLRRCASVDLAAESRPIPVKPDSRTRLNPSRTIKGAASQPVFLFFSSTQISEHFGPLDFPSQWLPVVMHHPLSASVLSVLSVLVTVHIHCLATPLAPRWEDMVVKHRWNTVPSNWERLSQPPANTTIDLHIALKRHRKSALIDTLYEVSDPRNPRYGAHLSKEQVAELVAPHPDTLEIVHSWLGHHGVPISSVSTSHGGNWLTVVDVPISQANDLLGASYQLYRHSDTNDTAVRTVSYALPAVLHTHVQTVAPTTFFGTQRTSWQTPRMHADGSAQARAESGDSAKVMSRRVFKVTPPFLRWLYKTAAYVPAAMDRNMLGVTGYIGQYPGPLDLRLFMNIHRIDAVDASFTITRINGGEFNPSKPGSEANLNIQYTQAMAYPTSHIFYSTGGLEAGSLKSTDDPYLNWLKYLLSQKYIPQTVSTSYSGPESAFPVDYAIEVCDLFAQLGLRGVSVLFSSGDFGVGSGNCKDKSGKVQFVPRFPASCPWLTSVGGTTSFRPEVAANISGGGFSNHFPRPKYQNDAVATFFQHFGSEPYAGLYNPGGRGIPDIAAQALKFSIVLKEEIKTISGTSCSTPTVAGVIALLNDFLLRNGRRPLGFLNLWLYDFGLAGLNDITSGSNPGCKTVGFPAVPGWDPVTGLGTPDFLKLQEILGNCQTNCSLAKG